MAAPVSKRKNNFTTQERAIIISGMEEFDQFLHGPESRDTSRARKQEILDTIATRVNALGNVPHLAKDILKKINDMWLRVREKLTKINKHRTGTGGGPPCDVELTPEDERIARCLHREQVKGIEGFDFLARCLEDR